MIEEKLYDERMSSLLHIIMHLQATSGINWKQHSQRKEGRRFRRREESSHASNDLE